jgi:hypothetical protein
MAFAIPLSHNGNPLTLPEDLLVGLFGKPHALVEIFLIHQVAPKFFCLVLAYNHLNLGEKSLYLKVENEGLLEETHV